MQWRTITKARKTKIRRHEQHHIQNHSDGGGVCHGRFYDTDFRGDLAVCACGVRVQRNRQRERGVVRASAVWYNGRQGGMIHNDEGA